MVKTSRHLNDVLLHTSSQNIAPSRRQQPMLLMDEDSSRALELQFDVPTSVILADFLPSSKTENHEVLSGGMMASIYEKVPLRHWLLHE